MLILTLLFFVVSYCDESCLHTKGLVKVDISASEILSNYNDSCDEGVKHYKGPLLGYVTPWNPEGKVMAKRFASKFDIISPVWHNIVLANNLYKITGEDEFDERFIKELKEKNQRIKIVPRFNLEKDALGKYYQLSGSAEAKNLAQEILTFAQYCFHGIID
eukprot:TRINITY_DN8509_c0_g1_i1.p1 TRINITY_DN8509_c0_g1~~TRINITY_DN8509_c0_g1_i1.p1  ORF type:complete len:175 (+),score=28.26 TRINITY_DN8509_c0_g1_i1:44-526(+)